MWNCALTKHSKRGYIKEVARPDQNIIQRLQQIRKKIVEALVFIFPILSEYSNFFLFK